ALPHSVRTSAGHRVRGHVQEVRRLGRSVAHPRGRHPLHGGQRRRSRGGSRPRHQDVLGQEVMAMTSTAGSKAGFAAVHDVPIPYTQRTRDYYLALGYSNPYRWAHFEEVPFTPLAMPLSRARLALITTAAPFQPGCGDQGPGAAYNAG